MVVMDGKRESEISVLLDDDDYLSSSYSGVYHPRFGYEKRRVENGIAMLT